MVPSVDSTAAVMCCSQPMNRVDFPSLLFVVEMRREFTLREPCIGPDLFFRTASSCFSIFISKRTD